jgi:hypothetical protein
MRRGGRSTRWAALQTLADQEREGVASDNQGVRSGVVLELTLKKKNVVRQTHVSEAPWIVGWGTNFSSPPRIRASIEAPLESIFLLPSP